MISGLGIPASGIIAASEKFAATATNVANVQSTGGPRARVDLAEQAVRAGVVSQQRTVDATGDGLVADMVDLRIEAGMYGVNATVLRAQDETMGSLLDVFA